MDFTLILIFILVLVAIIVFILWLNEKNKVEALLQKNIELVFQQKSIAVKHGKNWEHFVPLMQQFETVARKENAIFVGMPIDYISFEDDAIKFIEVKTGNSQLSKKQKAIKQLVEEKKIEWHEIRF